MSHHELDAHGPAWMETPTLCRSLSISRSSIGRWRRRELLGHGHHWVKKNPAAPRSDLLWHRHRCSALLGPSPLSATAQADWPQRLLLEAIRKNMTESNIP